MQKLYIALILPLTFLFCFDTAATTVDTAVMPDLATQRARFLEAENALEAGDLIHYQQLKAGLADYPLLPYLEYQEIVSDLRQHTPDGIRNAMRLLQGTPLDERLLDRWLALLAEEGLWHSYLSFSHSGGSIERQCHRLQALIETGKPQEAFGAVPKLWLSGTSRPAACDPAFDAWIDAGLLTQDLVWQRIDLAMKRGKTRLTRYLKRFLTEEERHWVDEWLALYADPARVSGFNPGSDHPYLDEMLTQAVQRLAWRDVDAAFDAWIRLAKVRTFSDWQHLQASGSLGKPSR